MADLLPGVAQVALVGDAKPAFARLTFWPTVRRARRAWVRSGLTAHQLSADADVLAGTGCQVGDVWVRQPGLDWRLIWRPTEDETAPWRGWQGRATALTPAGTLATKLAEALGPPEAGVHPLPAVHASLVQDWVPAALAVAGAADGCVLVVTTAWGVLPPAKARLPQPGVWRHAAELVDAAVGVATRLGPSHIRVVALGDAPAAPPVALLHAPTGAVLGTWGCVGWHLAALAAGAQDRELLQSPAWRKVYAKHVPVPLAVWPATGCSAARRRAPPFAVPPTRVALRQPAQPVRVQLADDAAPLHVNVAYIRARYAAEACCMLPCRAAVRRLGTVAAAAVARGLLQEPWDALHADAALHGGDGCGLPQLLRLLLHTASNATALYLLDRGTVAAAAAPPAGDDVAECVLASTPGRQPGADPAAAAAPAALPVYDPAAWGVDVWALQFGGAARPTVVACVDVAPAAPAAAGVRFQARTEWMARSPAATVPAALAAARRGGAGQAHCWRAACVVGEALAAAGLRRASDVISAPPPALPQPWRLAREAVVRGGLLTAAQAAALDRLPGEEAAAAAQEVLAAGSAAGRVRLNRTAAPEPESSTAAAATAAPRRFVVFGRHQTCGYTVRACKALQSAGFPVEKVEVANAACRTVPLTDEQRRRHRTVPVVFLADSGGSMQFIGGCDQTQAWLAKDKALKTAATRLPHAGAAAPRPQAEARRQPR